MLNRSNDIPPEESTFMDELCTDIIKQQAKRRKRTRNVIITLGVIAILLGGIAGWSFVG